MMDEKNTPPPLVTDTRNRPSLWFWLSAGSVILAFLIGLILLTFVVPVFAEMFADFGAELPRPTAWILNFSNFLKSYFFFIQLSMLGLTALCTWVLYELDKRKHIVAVILLGNLPPALVIIMIIAVLLPMAQLIRALN